MHVLSLFCVSLPLFLFTVIKILNLENQSKNTNVKSPRVSYEKKNMISETVWKLYFCSLHLKWWFKFLELCSFGKKISSIKKLPISKIESFIESKLGPK